MDAEYVYIMGIIANHERAGGHFFSSGAKRMFNSRWSEFGVKHNGKIYLVTSERYKSEPRRYTVRVTDEDCRYIETFGEFQEYSTRRQAWAAIKKITGKGL